MLFFLTISVMANLPGSLAHDDPEDDPDSRLFSEQPSPRCCVAADCLTGRPQRRAFLTTIRSPEYMTLLRELQCSIRRTNPLAPLIVLSVANELPEVLIDEVRTFAEYREVPNIHYENTYKPVFSKNWFKLNAWNLTEYTSIIMIDADAVVLGDLTHVFALPTDFAWSYLNSPSLNWNKGGFIMLRPCEPVFHHMLEILDSDESKQFASRLAEQSFFNWYFGYNGLRLPMIYNANSQHIYDSGLTAGGAKPLVLHFAEQKPMQVKIGDFEWPYMCYRFFQHHKYHSPLFE